MIKARATIQFWLVRGVSRSAFLMVKVFWVGQLLDIDRSIGFAVLWLQL